MEFIYGSSDMKNVDSAQANCVLMTNGLGGYLSVTAGYGVNRNDQGLLVAAESAPNKRNMLLHRMQEGLAFQNGRSLDLSTQEFADGTKTEEGYRHLAFFRQKEGLPEWQYFADGVSVNRKCCMKYGSNTTALLYRICNESGGTVTLTVTPYFTFQPKGQIRESAFELQYFKKQSSRENAGSCISEADGEIVLAPADRPEGMSAVLCTNGDIEAGKTTCQRLRYAFDARDGRPAEGYAASCVQISLKIGNGEEKTLSVLVRAGSKVTCGSCIAKADPGKELLPVQEAQDVFDRFALRQKELLARAGLKDPLARQLVLSADAYLSEKEATGGMTLLAGYPFFGDWGRDTMISLPGCTLVTGQEEAAKNILRTFLKYEKDGLVPNLFPDGNQAPMYNSVDAPLLLINGVWLYYEKTGDTDFLREAWPVLKNIMNAYRKGTHYGIRMDDDGLIMAGKDRYQLTWMDVCVNGFLPTPRHGKPVEINAYWYNALKIMEKTGRILGEKLPFDMNGLSEQVRESFRTKFWMEDRGYLRDVLSGTDADEQIRCNQVWALSLPYCMLSKEQGKRILAVIRKHLYTPVGLRTLSKEDKDFHPVYGGSLWDRDTAYHQGTVWPYPIGAYYLAYLKVHDDSPEAADEVRRDLMPMEAALREGCIGQLPEIYDGLYPGESRGCFAQAWSVGEILSVCSRLEEIESGRNSGKGQ